MNRHYEAKYHRLEEQHWWFRTRREIVRDLARQLASERSQSILEIGCSSGVLIRWLQDEGYQSITGIDISPEAISECHRRGIGNVQVMDAQSLAFPDNHFQTITASDVLEHLADDVRALREWHRVLRPGGTVIIFVPAFQSLWTQHDMANHHFRRYQLGELVAKTQSAGFEVIRQSYWNFSLFLPIFFVRALKRCFQSESNRAAPNDDFFFPPAPVNTMLSMVLRAENAIFRRGVNFPFGVSAMVIARKPAIG